MRRNTTTLFKLNNLHSLKFSFKLMQLDLQEIEDDPALNNRNLLKVLMKVASATSGPVAIYYKDGRKFIAVRSDTTINHQLDINLAPLIDYSSGIDPLIRQADPRVMG